MNKPYACCRLYGHYTHECPLLPQMRQAWEAQETSSRGPKPIAPPSPPPSSQPFVIINHFPHKGYIATQPTQGNETPPPTQSGWNNYQIIMMNTNEVNTEQFNL